MNFGALMATLLVGLFVFIGSMIGLYLKNNKTFIEVTVGMAFSIIVTIALLEILPETYEILREELSFGKTIIVLSLLISFGIVLLKILDLIIPNHSHENTHPHHHINNICRDNHLKHIGYMTAITLSIHNFIEGISFYIAACSTNALTMGLGIALHNLPLGLVIVSTLNHHTNSKKKTLLVSLIVSLSTFLGALVVFFSKGENVLASGIMLSITLGMLIYIAIFELLSQIRNMESDENARGGIMLGIFIVLISLFLE